MNQYAFIYGKLGWCRFDLRGNLLNTYSNPEDSNKWPILGKKKIFRVLYAYLYLCISHFCIFLYRRGVYEFGSLQNHILVGES